MQIYSKRPLGKVTGSSVPEPNEIEIQLSAHELFRLNGDSRGMQISASLGKLWVTQQGDPADYFLQSGEGMKISQRGTVLIQGFSNARVRMVLANHSQLGRKEFIPTDYY